MIAPPVAAAVRVPAAAAPSLLLTPRGLIAFGRMLPCAVGRGGIVATKREGDGGTPAGVHRVAGMWHRPDRVTAPVPWSQPIGPRDRWCDDPEDSAYNSAVRAPFEASAERMHRADRLYDIVVVLDWNLADPRPGEGSAIFMHRWRKPGHPTEGCIALDPADLAWLAGRLTPGTKVIVPRP